MIKRYCACVQRIVNIWLKNCDIINKMFIIPQFLGAIIHARIDKYNLFIPNNSKQVNSFFLILLSVNSRCIFLRLFQKAKGWNEVVEKSLVFKGNFLNLNQFTPRKNERKFNKTANLHIRQKM